MPGEVKLKSKCVQFRNIFKWISFSKGIFKVCDPNTTDSESFGGFLKFREIYKTKL